MNQLSDSGAVGRERPVLVDRLDDLRPARDNLRQQTRVERLVAEVRA